MEQVEQVLVTGTDEKLARRIMGVVGETTAQLFGFAVKVEAPGLDKLLANHRIQATRTKDEAIAELVGENVRLRALLSEVTTDWRTRQSDNFLHRVDATLAKHGPTP